MHDKSISEKASMFAPETMLDNVAGVVYSGIFIDKPQVNYITSKVAALTGFSPDEIISGKGWFGLIHSDDKPKVTAAFDMCNNSGRGFEVEYRIVKSDGEIAEVIDRVEPAFNERAEVAGFYGMCIDITGKKKAVRELERTQMLQNLGKLTAGIAHEINTPIQFVGDNLNFLSDSFADIITLLGEYQGLKSAAGQVVGKDKLDSIKKAEENSDLDFITDEIPQAISQSIDGIKRVSSMIAAMRDFSHIDERRIALADLTKALNSTLAILRNEIKYVADVKTDIAESLPMVMCCIDDIQQVFLNLIINASHSIKDVVDKGGKRGLITVSSRVDADQVVFTISDTGTGIPEDIRQKIFEPFFTTKGHCQGTGQGLAIVNSIITEKHKGRIELETEVGIGTTFTIYLPIDEESRNDG